jgi:hypothetical protein
MTPMLAKTDDGTTDVSITLDCVNVGLTISRVSAVTGNPINGRVAAKSSRVTYKVVF